MLMKALRPSSKSCARSFLRGKRLLPGTIYRRKSDDRRLEPYPRQSGAGSFHRQGVPRWARPVAQDDFMGGLTVDQPEQTWKAKPVYRILAWSSRCAAGSWI